MLTHMNIHVCMHTHAHTHTHTPAPCIQGPCDQAARAHRHHAQSRARRHCGAGDGGHQVPKDGGSSSLTGKARTSTWRPLTPGMGWHPAGTGKDTGVAPSRGGTQLGWPEAGGFLESPQFLGHSTGDKRRVQGLACPGTWSKTGTLLCPIWGRCSWGRGADPQVSWGPLLAASRGFGGLQHPRRS